MSASPGTNKLLAECRKDIFVFAKVMHFYPTFLQERFMLRFQGVIHELQQKVDPLLRQAEKHRRKGNVEQEEHLCCCQGRQLVEVGFIV